MKKKSMFIKFTLFLATLFISVVVPQQSFAEEATVDFWIHKQLWEKEPEESIQNTGTEMDFAGIPLEGAGFTVYDITEDYHQLVAGSTPQQVIQTIQENVADYALEEHQVTEEGFTAEDGIATFVDFPKIINGQDAVYLFVETTLPNTETLTVKAAEPLVIALPIYELDADGKVTDNELSIIDLYPKNFGKEVPVPEDPEKPEEPEKPEKPTPKPPKKRLPQTGEVKSMVGLLGVVLIGVAIVFWKQRTKNKS